MTILYEPEISTAGHYEPEIPTAGHYEITTSHCEITASPYEFKNFATDCSMEALRRSSPVCSYKL
jgi:hypothetical protein